MTSDLTYIKKLEPVDGKISILFETETGEEVWKEYIVVDKMTVYEQIAKSGEVHLPHSYIKDFSYREAVEYLPIEQKYGRLTKFYAQGAFFDGELTCFDKMVFPNVFADFREAYFHSKKVSFVSAKFDGRVSFHQANFGDAKVVFQYVIFLDQTVWVKSAVRRLEFKRCYFYNESDFRFEQCCYLLFSKCVLYGFMQFETDTFGKKDDKIESLIFDRFKNLGQIYIHFEENDVKRKIYEQTETSFAQKAEQFVLLKENYHNLGHFEQEDVAFVEYMRCRRQTVTNPLLRLLDIMIDKIGVYGTQPLRIALSMFIVWAMFGTLFMLLLEGLNGPDVLTEIDGLYFSGITFLTIGYGDVHPSNSMMKLLAPVEGIIGIVMMSYFTVSIVRRTVR